MKELPFAFAEDLKGGRRWGGWRNEEERRFERAEEGEGDKGKKRREKKEKGVAGVDRYLPDRRSQKQ